MTRALYRSCLVALMILCGACSGAAQPVLSAADAWIREAPPGASAHAGYVTLRNNGNNDLVCDRVTGADFGAAELHRSVAEDGVMRMLRDQRIELAAGGTAELKPGSYHIMLFRAQRDLRSGDRSELTIHCGDQQVSASFEVRPT
ncbi:copper chaperone PCu(A)C [Sinimarinibacterium sp. CAU 1509]|uniref:copper chaperone PCu(A)C n=1 Tax=Sinimarinibacterium sp. CAU 1509 TaxID=2562283 RepID=UPI0010AB81FE|nr:copper chaperone PCu(A)C [Sinimarinibacterium sp. CAU 1509]TJY62224.1 copper chaperone PCu(A)C [Sinimarinibacterium sp. CAU 1509]